MCRAGLAKPGSSHCLANHVLEDGYDIRAVQELLGHKDMKTTMSRNGKGRRSPIDGL